MNQDLKSRIPVAILYVLLICVLTLYGQVTTLALLAVFFFMSLYEFVSVDKRITSQISILIYVISFILAGLPLVLQINNEKILSITLVTCIFMTLNVLYLSQYRQTLLTKPPKLLLTILYVVCPFAIASTLTFNIEIFPKILLGTFIIVWLNDAGAYFIGKAIGKRKLFPTVSPGKTWEGLIGGGIVGFLIALFLHQILGVFETQSWLIISVIIWITGSYGDLTESSWKRNLGIKDSSHLMKGHGGFLDRLDSFIYAVPFVSLYVLLQQ